MHFSWLKYPILKQNTQKYNLWKEHRSHQCGDQSSDRNSVTRLLTSWVSHVPSLLVPPVLPYPGGYEAKVGLLVLVCAEHLEPS